jgi:regulator of PEP synthase PpsR (kinase-PPPase family)
MPIINRVPVDLSMMKKPLIVGLTISSDILHQIRSSRLISYKMDIENHTNNEYIEYNAIKDELKYAMRIFHQCGIPIIDVSRKAVEEVAAEIMSLHYIKRGENKN